MVNENDPETKGLTDKDLQAAARLTKAYQTIRTEMAKAIVGQEHVLEELLMCIFARGHAILEGVPGLAKTLMVSTLADALELSFHRIQFTPDLMPSDISGTEVIQEDKASGQRAFRFVHGPIFANLLLADEINRTPPKTQAALLQAMQEYRVTAGGRTYPLDLPFLVFATQNPIEQEGTYPLPEAQLDRFMFYVDVDYPSAAEEVEIVRSTTSSTRPALRRVLSPARIRQLQELVLRVPAADHVVRYAVDLVRATRPKEPGAPDFVKDYVAWGAGPRASQYLVLGAKSRAVLDGRVAASEEDVRALARRVLVHRVIANFRAESDGVSSRDVVDRLLEKVK